MKQQRHIIHCDADCFYASVEMRDDPDLRGRPLAIGGEAKGRGVVATCNYEARRFGVRSAMPMAYARRLCPGILTMRPNMEKYRDVSRQMQDIFYRYTDIIEPLSLDEAFLDVSREVNEGRFDDAKSIAEAIRQDVSSELQISVSAGVASNKFIAKVASDWQKPDGLTVVSEAQQAEFVAALAVNKIYGVGKVTEQKLLSMGITHCHQLQTMDLELLQSKFGSFGKRLYDLSRGRDHRPVERSRRRKSLSVEHTFASDLPDLDACLEQIPELLNSLQTRVSALDDSYRIAKPFVKLKFHDFSSTTVEKQGADYSLKAYQDLVAEAFERAFQPVRLLGLGVRFKEPESEPPQSDLFA
ncbi:DNA polymerase IV [Pseudoteredinibacter isoporae]|uniref:DNA polymerase IV n=1 Tax=Pseudoteredinibacter isoporae TaxID=570281 RepID=A0A7X0JR61_9GAMM|nr:DNA polymerase IV [Pseudoteredinibacter isoporae]MBB6520779.1 DNA polymerase-4 [Pseudoteredinibacter isoporae]NHO86345.1 DNA polymerase IV [Pseudoteredinibacter isoporae]NIB25203.1 DNA polymerase IV [Pseudoteredinibacter isoporae]